MITKEFIAQCRDAIQIANTGKDKEGRTYINEGRLNQAAWVGERAGHLLDAFEALQHEHTELMAVLMNCADQLNDVRTGDDFECDCWEVAEEAEQFVERIKERYKTAQDALQAEKIDIQAANTAIAVLRPAASADGPS